MAKIGTYNNGSALPAVFTLISIPKKEVLINLSILGMPNSIITTLI